MISKLRLPGPTYLLAGWLLLTGAVVALGSQQFNQGLQIRADIMALFPAIAQQPRVHQAIDRVNASIQRQVTLAATFHTRTDLTQLQALAARLQMLLDSVPLVQPRAAVPSSFDHWYRHRWQLLTDTVREALQRDPEVVLQRASQAIFGLAASASPVDLAGDPLQLHNQYLRSFAPAGLEPLTRHVFIGSSADGPDYLLVNFEVSTSAFDTDSAQGLLQLLQRLQLAVTSANGQAQISGLPVFAAHGSRSAQQEISVFGGISLAAVLLLLIGVFRDLRPLLGTIICLATGVFAAFVVTHSLFGEVHLITLVFGASLIGISVDYAFHYLCDAFSPTQSWAPRQSLLAVAPGITLAMLTSVLAFLSFLLTPFPGLRQIAVFSATGLFWAWLSTVALLPMMGWRPTGQHKPALLGWVASWSRGWPLVQPRWRWPLVAVAAIGIVLGLANLRPNDSVAVLQNAPAELLRQDQQVRALLPYPRASQFFIVASPTAQGLLERERALVGRLQNNLTTQVYALSLRFPAKQQQQQDLQLIRRTLFQTDADNPARLASWYTALGAPQLYDAAQQQLQHSALIDLPTWVADAPADLQALWLGCDNDGCRSIVGLAQVNDSNTVAQLAQGLAGVVWVDQVNRISTLLRQYRQLATQLLGAVCVTVVLAFALLFGWRRGLRIAAVPAVAVTGALAVYGLSGNPFNLFNLLGLLVVIGISVDYSLFYSLHGRHRPATALAISLSAMTTILAFGMLSFSTTTVVHSFGLTLLAGIGLAFLVAPLAAAPIQESLVE